MIWLGRSAGWALAGDKHFYERYNELLRAVEAEKARLQGGEPNSLEAKLLFAVTELVYKKVPADPMNRYFMLGNTLGPAFRSWRRVKFFQQYRLFYRFHSGRKIIIYSWFNDDSTLRAYGSKTDAYKEFAKMLEAGDPPTDFDELIASLGK